MAHLVSLGSASIARSYPPCHPVIYNRCMSFVELWQMSQKREQNIYAQTDQLYEPLRNALRKSTVSQSLLFSDLKLSRVGRNLRSLSPAQAELIVPFPSFRSAISTSQSTSSSSLPATSRKCSARSLRRWTWTKRCGRPCLPRSLAECGSELPTRLSMRYGTSRKGMEICILPGRTAMFLSLHLKTSAI